MRIWDINPGYLNRQSLLGEHRELHGIASIIVNSKTGYSKHPETLRWKNYGWALVKRHNLLSFEMQLRGYTEKSPLYLNTKKGYWPDNYIDLPHEQFSILKKKYINKEKGRIALPSNCKKLWLQTKYSVLAHNPVLFNEIEDDIKNNKKLNFEELAKTIVECLKIKPEQHDLNIAIDYMYNEVKPYLNNLQNHPPTLLEKLKIITETAKKENIELLLSSTAISELSIWI